SATYCSAGCNSGALLSAFFLSLLEECRKRRYLFFWGLRFYPATAGWIHSKEPEECPHFLLARHRSRTCRVFLQLVAHPVSKLVENRLLDEHAILSNFGFGLNPTGKRHAVRGERRPVH